MMNERVKLKIIGCVAILTAVALIGPAFYILATGGLIEQEDLRAYIAIDHTLYENLKSLNKIFVEYALFYLFNSIVLVAIAVGMFKHKNWGRLLLLSEIFLIMLIVLIHTILNFKIGYIIRCIFVIAICNYLFNSLKSPKVKEQFR